VAEWRIFYYHYLPEIFPLHNEIMTTLASLLSVV